METIKNNTVSFYGNYLTTSIGMPDLNLKNIVSTELYFVIKECYEGGKDTFLCSIGSEFGMISAESVLKFKKIRPGIKLFLTLSSLSGRDLKLLEGKESERYEMLNRAADDSICIESSDKNTVRYRQIDFLIGNTSRLIAYNDGKDEAANVVFNYAEKNGLAITNVYVNLHEYFSIDSPVKRFLQDYTDVPAMKFSRYGIMFGEFGHAIHISYKRIEFVYRKNDSLVFILSNRLIYIKALRSDKISIVL